MIIGALHLECSVYYTHKLTCIRVVTNHTRCVKRREINTEHTTRDSRQSNVMCGVDGRHATIHNLLATLIHHKTARSIHN